VFDDLPAGLRTLDVMELSLAAVRTAVMRHTLAEHPPDVLITIPRSSCKTLDFHKAEPMIELGRRLAEEALDRTEPVAPGRAVGGRPPGSPLSAS
jgi:NTE family protein